MLCGTRSIFPSPCFRKVRGWSGLIFCVVLCGLSAKPLLATTLPTTIALTVSPSTVAAQSPVTLTATVVASGTPAAPGQVVFCVATATFCEDLSLLGTAQVTSEKRALFPPKFNRTVTHQRMPGNSHAVWSIHRSAESKYVAGLM